MESLGRRVLSLSRLVKRSSLDEGLTDVPSLVLHPVNSLVNLVVDTMVRTCHGCHAPLDEDHQEYPSGWQKCQLEHWDGCQGGIAEGKAPNGSDWRGCPLGYVYVESIDDGSGSKVTEDGLNKHEITLDGEDKDVGRTATQSGDSGSHTDLGIEKPHDVAPPGGVADLEDMSSVQKYSGLHSGFVRFLLLATTSCLGGVADSVMSPYFCPLARDHGMGSFMCGMVISARFGTQIVFLLLFGRLMRNVGAMKIYMASVAMFATFNMMLATIVLVKNDQLFMILSFLFVILSSIGDAGIFCSIYVLAGQENFSLGCHKQKNRDSNRSDEDKTESNASGPAWMETTYACGSMLGPPIGGLIFILGGFGSTILTTGLCMTLVGCLTYFHQKKTCEGRVETPSSYTAANVRDDENQERVSEAKNTLLELNADENVGHRNKDKAENNKMEELTYLKAISSPTISSCCIIQISSGIASSWYLSSLESHLTQTMSLSTAQVGLVYMSPGLVYMLFTPVFGFLLDKGFKHIPILTLAIMANFLGYLLIGPSSLLVFLDPSPYYTVIGLLFHGLGMSATLMTCMSLMLDSTENPEDESNAGIVTSLWECCEMIGGYLGSTFGGLSTDRFGFRVGTNFVLCIEVAMMLVLLLLSTYNCHLKRLTTK